MDFDTAYCLDPAIWNIPPKPAKPEDCEVYLPGLLYPVRDPNNLCSFLTNQEVQHLQVNVQVEMRWFDLKVPEQLAELADLYQRSVLGEITIYAEESERERPFLKLLRYARWYYTIPQPVEQSLRSR